MQDARNTSTYRTSGDFQAATSRRMYNARATVYDDSWHPSFAQNVVDLVTIRPGDHILDLACGTGLVTVLAAERVGPKGHVLGIDISDGMLGVAAQRCSEFVDRGSVTLCHHSITDLASLPALAGKQGTFDVIACVSAFVLLTDPVKALTAWRQFLKPVTGRLVFDVIPPSNQPQGFFMEQAMLASRLVVPYHRTWATGEDAIHDLFKRASEDEDQKREAGALRIERIVFTRQQEWDTRYHDGSEQEALKRWEFLISSETFDSLKTETDVVKEEVRREFVRLWIDSGRRDNGNVMEIDGVYVAICVRNSGIQ